MLFGGPIEFRQFLADTPGREGLLLKIPFHHRPDDVFACH
jgi:hypothetical protein